MSRRAESLAARIEEGAASLAAFANGLSETEWHTPVPRDGRTVGVCVHHVASVYPIEVDLARTIASGKSRITTVHNAGPSGRPRVAGFAASRLAPLDRRCGGLRETQSDALARWSGPSPTPTRF